MLRLKIIILLIAGIIIQNSYCYDPLTIQEAIDYIENATKEQIILDIRRLDFLENSPPTVEDPKYTALLMSNGDLVIHPLKKILLIKHGHLEYEIELKNYVISDFGPNKNLIIGLSIGGAVLSAALGFLIGFFFFK